MESHVSRVPMLNNTMSQFVEWCRYHVFGWWCHCRRIAPTLFPRRGNNRADNSRPYADVPHRTLCVFCGTLTTIEFVGADSIRPPTWQIYEQNRFGRTGFRCCKIYHVRHCAAEFRLQMFDGALSAHCADVVSPMGKQPGG